MTLSLVVNLTDITNYAYNEFEAKLSFLALCYNRVSLYIYIYIYIYRASHLFPWEGPVFIQYIY